MIRKKNTYPFERGFYIFFTRNIFLSLSLSFSPFLLPPFFFNIRNNPIKVRGRYENLAINAYNVFLFSKSIIFSFQFRIKNFRCLDYTGLEISCSKAIRSSFFFFFSFLIPEGIFFSDQGRSISIFQAIRYRVSEKHEKRKERERGKKTT